MRSKQITGATLELAIFIEERNQNFKIRQNGLTDNDCVQFYYDE